MLCTRQCKKDPAQTHKPPPKTVVDAGSNIEHDFLEKTPASVGQLGGPSLGYRPLMNVEVSGHSVFRGETIQGLCHESEI